VKRARRRRKQVPEDLRPQSRTLYQCSLLQRSQSAVHKVIVAYIIGFLFREVFDANSAGQGLEFPKASAPRVRRPSSQTAAASPCYITTTKPLDIDPDHCFRSIDSSTRKKIPLRCMQGLQLLREVIRAAGCSKARTTLLALPDNRLHHGPRLSLGGY
jgi:hypothetical protein